MHLFLSDYICYPIRPFRQKMASYCCNPWTRHGFCSKNFSISYSPLSVWHLNELHLGLANALENLSVKGRGFASNLKDMRLVIFLQPSSIFSWLWKYKWLGRERCSRLGLTFYSRNQGNYSQAWVLPERKQLIRKHTEPIGLRKPKSSFRRLMSCWRNTSYFASTLHCLWQVQVFSCNIFCEPTH